MKPPTKPPLHAEPTERPHRPAHAAAQYEALLAGRHPDPFSVLGPHAEGDRVVVRACLPDAMSVTLAGPDGTPVAPMESIHPGGLFAGTLPPGHGHGPADYRLVIEWPDGTRQCGADPYAFGLLLGDLDLHLFNEGRHLELSRAFGAQWTDVDGIEGVRFAVWAPNASRVSLLGDFNGWHPARHPMRLRYGAGVWELFIPATLGASTGDRYKFDVADASGHSLPDKADPVALATEVPPGTASVIPRPCCFTWTDDEWMRRRAGQDPHAAPMLVYEVHAGSWMQGANDTVHGWDFLADRLIPYVADMGFTHVELLPITEHPFGGSWGYQPLSLFAPTARFGPPEDFANFVDRCHAAGIGVILDWVPAHFPSDPHGLAHFDGTALYEHEDPREGYHQDWNTLIYNLGRNEVKGFLLASAMHWLREYHVDGLRVDAVASMLYRDYSRQPGEWIPNRYGGRENLEAIAFLRELNTAVHEHFPGAMTIAEESTAWPGVTAPAASGGLGFTFKWNMGWMHDSLRYVSKEPVHRAWHHQDWTFGMVYAWSEAFVLPLSHDEVVHGKGSLAGKMPGDDWQKFANLRAYYGFMWAHPGKKLLFMGGELGQWREWNHDAELDWGLLDNPAHRGVQTLVRDLNGVAKSLPALHAMDHRPEGFQWVIGDDNRNSVFAFLRYAAPGSRDVVLAVSNMTPVPREGYRIGVPFAGRWEEVINTDAGLYGGGNVGNGGMVDAVAEPSHGQPASAMVTLPPLGTVLLRYVG